MRGIPGHPVETRGCSQWQGQLPPSGQFCSELDVGKRANQPQKADRMRQYCEQCEDPAANPVHSARSPQERQRETSQAERQIVVDETHAEGIAIGQHGDARHEKPGRPFGDRAYEREDSPEKNQHTRRNRNFLCRGKTHNVRKAKQGNVKQDVVPLLREVQSLRLALLNQLRQPRVVDMAGQVTRLDPAVPETRSQDPNADGKNDPSRAAQERQRQIVFIQEARPRLSYVLKWSHRLPSASLVGNSKRAQFYLNSDYSSRIP